MIDKIISEHQETANLLYSMKAEIEKVSLVINNTLNIGKKLLIMGNGGSASDAQHFAAEIVGRFKAERKGYPAIALTTDTSILTSVANDYSYEQVFSRQIQALAVKEDVVIGLSTSGNSRNVIEGFKEADRQGCIKISLLGKDGGALAEMSDYPLVIRSDTTARVQECHILIIHMLCELFEAGLNKC